MLLTAYIACMLMTIVSITYADHIDSQSNRRWCGVMTTLDDAYTEVPPQQPAGIHLAQEIKTLRHEFDC
jgi:hypothetical protein